MKILLSGNYNAFAEGFNGAGVYMASGRFESQTFERPIYIGSAVDLRDRIELQHIPALNKEEWVEGKTKTNKPLYCAWKKHSGEAFVWFLVESCKPEDAQTLEQFYLDKERPFCDEMRGYNVCKQADGGMRGRRHSEETKARISASGKGRKLSAAHTEAFRKAWNEGKRDRAQIIALGKSSAKPYALLNPQGEFVTGTNLTELCRKHSLEQRNLSAVVAGKRKSHKGWKLAKEEA